VGYIPIPRWQAHRETSRVDIGEVVEGIPEENSREIRERGTRVDISGDLGIVKANPVQVQQVFSNLIGNAIGHNESENPVVRVSRPGDDEDGVHRYLVRDNGPGVPEEIIDEIFNPFARGKGGGTGIGLSIVRRIVNACGGEITVYNDSGACFEFTFRDFQETPDRGSAMLPHYLRISPGHPASPA